MIGVSAGYICLYVLSRTLCIDIASILLGIITVCAGISNIAIILFGYKIYKHNNHSKGSKYYPSKFDKQTNKIISNTSLKTDLGEIYDVIQNLLRSNHYFEIAEKLQFTDPDFKILWNDYNFYSACKQTKKNKNRRDLIEKYVFQKIYDEYERKK